MAEIFLVRDHETLCHFSRSAAASLHTLGFRIPVICLVYDDLYVVSSFTGVNKCHVTQKKDTDFSWKDVYLVTKLLSYVSYVYLSNLLVYEEDFVMDCSPSVVNSHASLNDQSLA